MRSRALTESQCCFQLLIVLSCGSQLMERPKSSMGGEQKQDELPAKLWCISDFLSNKKTKNGDYLCTTTQFLTSFSILRSLIQPHIMQLFNLPCWQSLIFTRLHAMYLIFIFIFKYQQPKPIFFLKKRLKWS